MKKNIFDPLLFASLCNFLLFAIFFLLTKPIYDTEEDVYVLYLLSGGFGNDPTELLHYNHIIHPYLGYLLKTLFSINDNVNWYSVALTLSHYTACTIILYCLLGSNQAIKKLFIYLLFFVVFESKFLITLNFSNTAIMLGCSGIFLLFAAFQNAKTKLYKLVFAILILLLAAMFRIHVLAPLLIVSFPFMLIFRTKKIFFVLSIGLGLIFLLNHLHQHHYRSKIAGWQKEENYRQSIYQLYNHRNLQEPIKGQKWYTEFSLINSGLAIDTSFLSNEKLKAMFVDLRKSNTQKASIDTKYWFWINNRLFFFTAIFIFTLALANKKVLITSLSSLLLIIGVFALLLILFSKLPEYILVSTLFLWCLLVLLFCTEIKNYNSRILAVLILLQIFWGCIRILKNNKNNISSIHYFRSAFSEISKQPQILFIITGDQFPLQKFYVWDLPKNYLLFNILGNDHFLNNIYSSAYKRYDIHTNKGLTTSPNVLFWGSRTPALEEYFNLITHKPIFVSPPLSTFKYGPVYKITALK